MAISKNSILLSLALHLFLSFLLISFSNLNQSSWLLSHIRRKNPLEALTYIQVDLVGLPDHLVSKGINPLLPQTKDTHSVVPKSKAVSEQAKDKKTESEKSDDFVLKSQKKAREEALQKAQIELKKEEALKALRKETESPGRAQIKGNKLSQGTSSFGTVGTPKDRYLGILTETIKQQFNIFSWQQKKGLVAEVTLMLQNNGRVKWRRITKPSQDLMYDSAVLQAIDDAQPFPIPEDKNLIAEEIRINFRP